VLNNTQNFSAKGVILTVHRSVSSIHVNITCYAKVSVVDVFVQIRAEETLKHNFGEETGKNRVRALSRVKKRLEIQPLISPVC